MNHTQQFAVVAFLFVSLFTIDAFACKCIGEVDPRDMEIGFWGTAQSVEPKGAIDRVTFSVDQQFRGSERDSVLVHAPRFHHDCGIRFQPGKSYVVYAYSFHPRGVATSQCWYTYQRDEAPTEAEFSRPDLDITEPTELETQIRKMARDKVIVCGKAVRVNDAGFSIVLSPAGDPIAGEVVGPINNRDQTFQQCVMEALIGELPRPEEPVLIEGWYQSGNEDLPVLIDQLPCGEECPDWSSIVREALFEVELPLDEVSARSKALQLDGFGLRKTQLDAAAAICPFDGIQAAKDIADSGNAPPAAPEDRARVLLDCALARGEMKTATEFLAGSPSEALSLAVEWAAENERPEDPYPVRTTDVSFPAFWFKHNADTLQDNHRVLRTAILNSAGWANQPLFLEAFAEAIIADEDATPQMKNYAAIAYQKAARLRPAAKDAYTRLATNVETTAEYAELQKELDAAVAKAEKARAQEKAEQEALAAELEAEDAVGDEEWVEEEGGLDPLWLGLGALVLVVIAAGAFQRMRS